MTAQAWFTEGDTHVAPGESAILRLTVVNLGDTTETFTLVPVGLAAGWTTLRPATLTLFGGVTEVVDVDVHPPLLPSTSAGNTALSVRIIPQTEPDEVSSAETAIVVRPVQDRRLTLLQPAQRARRRATYELMLENRGNTQASCRMRVVDASGRIDADFDPPSIGVEPGATALVRARLRTTKLQWERHQRTVPFRIEADQQGAPVASTTGTFVQAPFVPERLWGRLFVLLVLAGVVVGGWFAVVRPAIRDAAADAVAVADRQPATVTTTSVARPPATGSAPTGPGGTGAATTTDPAAAATVVVSTVPPAAGATGGAEGAPFAQRLTPDNGVANGQTGDKSYAAAAGTTVNITDLILQNPSSDAGTATLLRGADEVLFTWRLDNIPTQLSTPLVTPIVLQPGEQLTLRVVCSGVGPFSSTGTCVPGVLLLGRTTPNP
jgi:hypothetical protein